MSDDKETAVLVQKFNDFIDNTEKYRRGQEEAQRHISDKLESRTQQIFTKLDEMKAALLKLPCDGRKVLWDAKMDGIAKDSRNQWVVIGSLWAVVGSACYIVFQAWVSLIKR